MKIPMMLASTKRRTFASRSARSRLAAQAPVSVEFAFRRATVMDFARTSSTHQYASDLTCARLARRYAAASSRITDMIGSMPVTSSNA
jgi:hypothetical protein